MRRVREELTRDIGRTPSAIQSVLIERCVWLSLRRAQLDRKIASGRDFTEIDSNTYLAWNNSLVRTLRALGLDPNRTARASQPDTMTAVMAEPRGDRSSMTMTRANSPPRPPNNGEIASLATLARHYRHQTIATLVTISNDRNAPASARASAARTLMEYSDGRPGQSRAIAVEDIEQLDDTQCETLFGALLRRFDQRMPGFLDNIARQLIADMQARAQGIRPNRYTRGTPPPTPPHVPVRDARWSVPPIPARDAQPRARHTSPICADQSVPSMHGSGEPLPTHGTHAQPISRLRRMLVSTTPWKQPIDPVLVRNQIYHPCPLGCTDD